MMRVAIIAFCLAGLSAVDAMAHVRTPDYGRLGRTPERVQPEPDSFSRSEAAPAARRQACDFSRGIDPSSAEVVLAASQFGAAGRELLDLVEAFPAALDVVRVAQGVTPDGAPCPLYVSFGEEGDTRQTFWRFAPDDEPEGWFDEDGRRLGAPALATPRPGSRISSPFGPRRYYGRPSGGGFHNGIDYEARVGQPILAAADGVVELQGTHFEYGLTVKIRHADRFTTLYAHLSRFAADTAVGGSVRKGQIIGYVGMTGRSTGAHLHFSTIVDEKFVDPAPYLSDAGDRIMKPRALASFRKWQDDVQAAVKAMRDRQRRSPVRDDDWTSRI